MGWLFTGRHSRVWIYYCNVEGVWGRLRTYCFPIAQCRFSEINPDSMEIIPLQISIEVYNKKVGGTTYNAHTWTGLSGCPCTSFVSRPEVVEKKGPAHHVTIILTVMNLSISGRVLVMP